MEIQENGDEFWKEIIISEYGKEDFWIRGTIFKPSISGV